ncbi:LOB domain-containing protein 2 [Morus notabilis]|uniref:LOB domain-containing protein 2 n=1 Tax=Morus notabilis TaxID=981085 RepID=UPI000CED473D|nr:LOB domain-containing protein 2 [Morus notabilis]
MTRMQRNSTSAGAQPACAACKHQRKKCHQSCVLAPYFPAERSREFHAVHKVFGVSNVTKMSVNEEDRRRAVDSLVWEACCRQKDPVLGPYAEYRKVFEELKLYKSQENGQMMHLSAQSRNFRNGAYKSLSSLVNWNSVSNGINGNHGMVGGIVNNNSLSYFHENGSVIVDQSPFSYASSYVQSPEKIRQEKNVDNVVPIVSQQHQQHAINGFNQQYYLSGQLNQVNSKTIESTIWDGRS